MSKFFFLGINFLSMLHIFYSRNVKRFSIFFVYDWYLFLSKLLTFLPMIPAMLWSLQFQILASYIQKILPSNEHCNIVLGLVCITMDFEHFLNYFCTYSHLFVLARNKHFVYKFLTNLTIIQNLGYRCTFNLKFSLWNLSVWLWQSVENATHTKLKQS